VLGHTSEASRVRAHALLKKGCRPAFAARGLAGELESRSGTAATSSGVYWFLAGPPLAVPSMKLKPLVYHLASP
jgi:hypothetical protein